MTVATILIAAAAALALLLGVLAGRGRRRGLEGWSVGGRRFGTVLVFLLMAGEIYTTFTFLGASGYAYGKGAPSYYILAYFPLAYVLSYWMLPPIWRYARAEGLVSQPDFLARKYRSPALGLLAAAVGVVALVPYLVLQLKGLGIIVATASGGVLSAPAGAAGGAAVMTAYVVVSGVHGPASVAAIKDVAILVVVVSLGIFLPVHIAGGIGPMFEAIDHARPGFLAFPARGQSLWWFDSTVALTAVGFFMWPHSFASVYTARSETTLRRNAVAAPLYGLLLVFALLIGFAALLRVPGLTGSRIDLALLRVSVAVLPMPLVGAIGAAGVLTALVPGSMMLVSASTILANDLWGVARRHQADARELAVAAKLFVPAVAAVALWCALAGGETIVVLLLLGYALVTQLFPAVIASLAPRPLFTAGGAFAGVVAGVAVVVAMTLAGRTPAAIAPFLPRAVLDLNVGVVALAANVSLAAAVTRITRAARIAP